MIFNYKRVSTIDQNTDRQLINIPCDREYEDKLSGKNTNRPQLQAMLDNLRPGDIVNVHSMDRLARNVKDLLSLIEIILEKKATINFLKENLTFSSNEATNAFQTLMLTMLGAINEFERNIILERQKEGIAIAKAKGKYKGTNKLLTDIEISEIKRLSAEGVKPKALTERYGVSRQTIYNYIKG